MVSVGMFGSVETLLVRATITARGMDVGRCQKCIQEKKQTRNESKCIREVSSGLRRGQPIVVSM